MLPASARLRSSAQFRLVTRAGRRAGRRTVVVHILARDAGASLAGFVVPKTVGPAVWRNRTKRRLRHLIRDRLERLPGSYDVVVRALPAAGTEPGRLADDLDSAWAAVLR